MAGFFDNLFAPNPEHCPAPPVELPAEIQDLLPDLPPPPPPEPEPPSRADLIAAAAAIAATITQAIKDDDECEHCENCLAVQGGTGGIPPRMPYPDTRTNRVGYEYQHHVVNWFYHDRTNRIIMEWQVGPTWFDGLDPKEGMSLATRAIARSEYDPGLTSYCYLIDTKYGYDSWMRYDVDEEQFTFLKPSFLMENLLEEVNRQAVAAGPLYPNVAVVWVCSQRHVRQFFDEEVISHRKPQFRTVYYPYTALEDRT
ncbi:hypothetical protein [Jannaschia marina]|uniref:hypothetical protein n=1 Tax=Jannaschia marina TaxID=2741674 RepID=UPI0015CA9960|nr:hypothetical protein [Jannaschia marina]